MLLLLFLQTKRISFNSLYPFRFHNTHRRRPDPKPLIENHDDLASYFYEVLETVENPDLVIRGHKGTLKATRNFGKNKWIVVIYREVSKNGGFIITAYILDKRPKGEIIWKQQ